MTVLAFLWTLAASGVVAAETPTEFRGKLSPEPIPEESRFMPMYQEPASAEMIGKLPGPPAEGSRISHARLPLGPLDRKRDLSLYLVQPAQGEPYLFADLDRDGKIVEAERVLFNEPADQAKKSAVLLRIPLQTGPYGFYPVRLRLTEFPGESEPRLLRSGEAWVEGTVDFGSRKLFVRYTLDPVQGTADPRRGHQEVDLDGNGKIEPDSSETDMAFNERLIFHVGDLYLSTESLDPKTGEVVLRTHPASEYVRFDLTPGTRIPDFAFTDLAGKSRSSSELRGKVVLLEFWGTWCAPCVQDIPKLQEAYEAFHGRGFEILSLDAHDDLDTLQKFVAARKLPWVQARPEGIEELIAKRFRVYSFPTLILLDREGKVVVSRLEAEDLKKKLEEILPAGPAR
jgi:thiol-disulfide isomerase/thioredoxin